MIVSRVITSCIIMEFYLSIILSLLAVSYTLYIVMFIVLSQQHIFSESLFFTLGSKFALLGVTFENQTFYVGLCFFFFFNSFIAQLNSNIVSPVFSRLIFSHPEEDEHHGNGPGLSKNMLYFILVTYNLWSVARSLFGLLGIISNFGFFIATSLGFVLSDLGVKYVYINWPEMLNFQSKAKTLKQGREQEQEQDNAQVEDERKALLKNAVTKLRF